MTGNQPLSRWDDEIDLRHWVAALIRGKYIIGVFLLVSVALATALHVLFLQPTYESFGSVSLPVADGNDGVGMTLLEYQVFATSDATMDQLREELGSPLTSQQIRRQYQFQWNEPDRTLTVEATASDPDEAFLLANTFILVFSQSLQSTLTERFSSQIQQATERRESLLRKLTEGEYQLELFDAETALAQSEAHLAALEQELAQFESELSQLGKSTIPAKESQLATLQNSLSSNTVASVGIPSAPTIPAAGAISGLEELDPTLSDPEYLALQQRLNQALLSSLEQEQISIESRIRQLQLFTIPTAESNVKSLEALLKDQTGSGAGPSPQQISQELETTKYQLIKHQNEYAVLAEGGSILRSRIETARKDLVWGKNRMEQLASNSSLEPQIKELQQSLNADRRAVESLTSSIPGLREEIGILRRTIAAARSTRAQLQSDVDQARLDHESASSELTNLQELQPHLNLLTSAGITEQPKTPTAPTAPQRTRNVVLLGFLGLVLGVMTVLFREWYQVQSVTSLPGDRVQRPDSAADAES